MEVATSYKAQQGERLRRFLRHRLSIGDRVFVGGDELTLQGELFLLTYADEPDADKLECDKAALGEKQDA